jgi:type IV secretion system protein VirB10
VSERAEPESILPFEESPSGLDINPRPPKPAKVSRRAAGAVIVIAVIILALFAYGGYKRQERQVAALAERGIPRTVGPATAAGADIAKAVPASNVPFAPPTDGKLVPPNEPPQTVSPSQGYRAPVPQTAVAPPPLPTNPEPTPEQRRQIAAYEAEQQAMTAPTTLRNGIGQRTGSPGTPTAATVQTADIARLIRSLTTGSARGDAEDDPHPEPDKREFLDKARSTESSNYLKSNRTPPLSPYEIKAGWEIPAVLEQALNSDLPGELKALVSSNVYDTATGRYLLIPQGSRLVGIYDSQVGYGQDGAQVVWSRIIYPDSSSIDLGGMVGQDAHGAAGFRGKVDRHYRRLIGFAVLTSLFAASTDLAQSRNRSLLTYPSPGEIAASAVGREVSEVGAQITRRNLNVQPTIKVPIGYPFNVRVNRDILFDAPYTPITAQRP